MEIFKFLIDENWKLPDVDFGINLQVTKNRFWNFFLKLILKVFDLYRLMSTIMHTMVMEIRKEKNILGTRKLEYSFRSIPVSYLFLKFLFNWQTSGDKKDNNSCCKSSTMLLTFLTENIRLFKVILLTNSCLFSVQWLGGGECM